MRITFSFLKKWQKSTDGLLKYAEKSAKYIHQDTMKKTRNFKMTFHRSCHVNLFVRLHRCKNRYSGGNEALFAGEVRRRSKRK